MSQCFSQLDIHFDVTGIVEFLQDCHFWGEYPQRGEGASPHREMVDIWARFNDPAPYIKSGDWSGFTGEHESVWLKEIPGVRDISDKLMTFLDGSRLGGVLLTKLPPGGRIYPHTDNGWHAKYYDKYFIPLVNEPGAKFVFPDGEIEPLPGETWAFRNDVSHAVENYSEKPRIALIVCIKQNRLTKWGSRICHGQQPQR